MSKVSLKKKKNFYMTQMEELDTVKILQEKCFLFSSECLEKVYSP